MRKVYQFSENASCLKLPPMYDVKAWSLSPLPLSIMCPEGGLVLVLVLVPCTDN